MNVFGDSYNSSAATVTCLRTTSFRVEADTNIRIVKAVIFRFIPLSDPAGVCTQQQKLAGILDSILKYGFEVGGHVDTTSLIGPGEGI